MRAELISVGTELLLGQILNTNAKFLAEELALLGIDIYFQSTVGDNRERLLQTLKIATGRADLIILTGGIGPTEDDLTKETLAEFLQLPLEIVLSELANIKKYFQKANLNWTENNRKQAAFIPGAVILKNERGTAPGMALRKEGKGYLVFPGPPSEVTRMFYGYALPWLKASFPTELQGSICSTVLKFTGITESGLETLLEDLFRGQKEITIALYVKPNEIQLRVTAKAQNNIEFKEKTAPLLQKIKQRTIGYFFAEDQQSMTDVIAELLEEKHLTISTAESCTGGMLAEQFTAIPGSSAYFLGAVVAYDNQVKADLLGVSAKDLAEFGAVSQEVGTAMAEGIRTRLGTTLSIGITGIAGPGGGTGEKPVGLVYIALAKPGSTICKKYYFNGERDKIRQKAVLQAQYLLWRYLKNYSNEEY